MLAQLPKRRILEKKKEEEEEEATYLDLFSKHFNQWHHNLIHATYDQHLAHGKRLEPGRGRIKRIRVKVRRRAVHVHFRPRLAHKRRDNVAAVVNLPARQVRVQRRPRRNGAHASEGAAARYAQGRDARVRVREVREHAEREVAAGRVAAQEDLTGGPAGLLEDVAEALDGLGELDGVDAVGGEGVGEGEDGEVAARGVDVVDDALEKGKVADIGGKTEAAAWR